MGVRNTDPITSWMGEWENRPRRPSQQLRLLAAYAQATYDGLSTSQAAHAAGMTLYAASKRISELIDNNWIVPRYDSNGELVLRTSDESGSKQRVCCITLRGQAHLKSS